MPPASPQNLRALLDRDASTGATEGEDVLLSEGRIASETHEPWEPPPTPSAVGNFDARTAIFRAREAHRERIRAKAAAARQSAGIEAIAADRFPNEVAQVPVAVNVESELTESSDVSARHQAHESQADRPEPAEHLLSQPRATALDIPPVVVGQDPSSDQFEPAELQADNMAVDDMGEVCVAEGLVARRAETEFESESDPIAGAEDLPDWFRTDLPRVCRTCRDFRPAADGQRGWCANAWAFTHRQLVQVDDAAPCHSAIGDWWAPVDDVWLVAADVSTHGRTTPLLDQFLAGESAQRRRS